MYLQVIAFNQKMNKKHHILHVSLWQMLSGNVEELTIMQG